jgi:uncharacterized BrkB/YihY/UPF0761 family membrane protein
VETARTALAMVLSIALPLLVQLADRRRMSEEMRARTWNYATWGGSLYAFGPASMLGWMWVTRPPWWRVLFGAIATAALLALTQLADLLFALAAGVALEDGEAFGPLVVFALGAAVAAGLLAIFEIVAWLWARVTSRRAVPVDRAGADR